MGCGEPMSAMTLSKFQDVPPFSALVVSVFICFYYFNPERRPAKRQNTNATVLPGNSFIFFIVTSSLAV